MRGEDRQQHGLFSYGSLGDRLPQGHPLRPIRAMVDGALKRLSPKFDEIYGEEGRPSITPGAAAADAVHGAQRADADGTAGLQLAVPLVRWPVYERVGVASDGVFQEPGQITSGRDRPRVFRRVLKQALRQHLLSSEHFTVDGTMIEAWAGQKSFRPRTAMTRWSLRLRLRRCRATTRR